jgi:hypothetical protein
MIHDKAEHAYNQYRKARQWLDDHPVTTITRDERIAAHQIVAHWRREIESL